MRYIGYIEISVGVGLGMGPTIGSAVYKFLDYEGTMYFFTALNVCGLLICLFLIPNVLNYTLSREELDAIKAEQIEVMTVRTRENKPIVTWGTVLSNRHAVFALLTCFIGTFDITFY